MQEFRGSHQRKGNYDRNPARDADSRGIMRFHGNLRRRSRHIIFHNTQFQPSYCKKATGGSEDCLNDNRKNLGKKAARCCQRECYIALREAARLSAELLPVRLRADYPMTCEQYSINRECITSLCELYPNASYRSVKIKKQKEREILVPLPAAPESLTRK